MTDNDFLYAYSVTKNDGVNASVLTNPKLSFSRNYPTGALTEDYSDQQNGSKKQTTIDSKTCMVCGLTWDIEQFIHTVRGGRRRKVRSYCNTCRDTHSQTQITNIINSKLQPRTFNPPKITLPQNDLSMLASEKIMLIGPHNEWSNEVTLRVAHILAKEQAVRIIGPNKIRMVFNHKNFKEFILNRDGYRCIVCQRPASTIQRIVKKSDGGFRTPVNVRTVCQTCSQFSNKDVVVKKTITYAIPVYWNNSSEIHSAIENPNPPTLQFASDPHHLRCFCDISESPSIKRHYGVAMVTVGGGLSGIQIQTKTITLEQRSPSTAEAQAVAWAIQSLCVTTCRKISIHTDTNFAEYRQPKSKELSDILTTITSRPKHMKIVYLDSNHQKKPLYRLAHKFSRLSAHCQ